MMCQNSTHAHAVHLRSIYYSISASFDVLGAESMGQIGYILAQALSSAGLTTAPIICQVVVDPQHDAFRDPSKFIGPVYGAKEATALSQASSSSYQLLVSRVVIFTNLNLSEYPESRVGHETGWRIFQEGRSQPAAR